MKRSSTKVVLEPSESMHEWLTAYARRFGVTIEAAASSLFAQIDAILSIGDNVQVLGAPWLTVWRTSTTSSPAGQSTRLSPALLKVLERAATQSGYKGVYPNGGSFRAQVPDPKSPTGRRYLASRSTPEEAAWDRYVFLRAQQATAPTTTTDEDTDYQYIRELHPDWSDAKCREEARITFAGVAPRMNAVASAAIDAVLEAHAPSDEDEHN